MTQKTRLVRLLERVAALGKAGDIVEVSHTQATNVLIPKKLAVALSDTELKQAETQARAEQRSRDTILRDAKTLTDSIDGMSWTFEIPLSGNKLGGSLSEHDIATRVSRHLGIIVERKHIALPEGKHLKTLGTNTFYVKLSATAVARCFAEIVGKKS